MNSREIESLPFTIAALQGAYSRGLTPVALVDEVLRRIEAADDPGIFISIAGRENLLREAEGLGAHDPDRPLWGIPVAVKDNIDVADLPTTAACPDYAYLPSADAGAVEKLRVAGALIIGKTNLDQFATGLVGVRTPYPVPQNPINADLVPGGSSSGSAVAVARGIVSVALGTDTAGSGRVPAAFNNIVGLKPSLGSVSTRGVVPACRSLDCVSVFALTVEDAWKAYSAIAGFDGEDPYSVPAPRARTLKNPSQLRVGVPRMADRAFTKLNDSAAFQSALETIVEIGEELVLVPFVDFFDVAKLLYNGPWLAERYAIIRELLETHPESVLPVIREIVGRGASISAVDAFEGFYKLQELRRRTEKIWQDIDVICVPSTPGPCTLNEIEAAPIARNAELGTYTNFVNLLGLSALAVPTQWRDESHASGVTLIGQGGDDELLAQLGAMIQTSAATYLGATAWPVPHQSWVSDVVTDEVPVVVFGAHLAGLPLNPELRRQGARFDRAVSTAPDYRLFALDGTMPRPGLVRVKSGEGMSIDGEIWLMPVEGFGRFVAGIAPPLVIGNVQLDDGSVVKGFLAESEGVRNTTDISRSGGWRQYLATRIEAEPAK